jgi:hypothetical protein
MVRYDTIRYDTRTEMFFLTTMSTITEIIMLFDYHEER